VYVVGEGDFLAMEVVSRFLDVNKSISRLVNCGIPSSLCRSGDDIVRQPLLKKEFELEKIPSPWLNGVQDHFFDGKLIPMIETNRGCPFRCTFCVQGTDYYSRVAHFEEDQVKEELTYIARRLLKVCPQMGALMVADPNFGMYKRDVDISVHIGTLQKKYNWPTFIDCSTGKNAPELVIKVLENTNGALSMLHAVQSVDENVLKSIKRSNIKLDTYKTVTEYLSANGVHTSSQTILGLPKETLQTHLTGLASLVDQGIKSLQNFQLMLLKGSEMESQDSRNEFKFKTKFRLSPRCFGTYDGEAIFDIEEIVVSTESLSFDDYICARNYHLAYMVFWSQGWFDDLFSFAQNVGIKNVACVEAVMKEMNSDDGAIGRFMKGFVEETKGELFSTSEECFRYYAEDRQFGKLASGKIGDNLLNKFRAIASFLLWPQICQLMIRAVKGLIVTHGSEKLDLDIELFLDDLYRYIESRHACGWTLDEIISPVSCELQYDIPRWVACGYQKILTPYKLEKPKTFLFKLSENGAKEIRDSIETWSADLQGLTRVARYIKLTSQVRQCV